ncbi:MAG: hypothetical protein QXL14_02330 [Candidatus Aenigmatarchaeota archaeon]
MIAGLSNIKLFLLVTTLILAIIPTYSRSARWIPLEEVITNKTERECIVDAECKNIFCPQVVGMDTPRCISGICRCGPNPELNISELNYTIINKCLEYRERIRNIIRWKNITEEPVEEIEKLKIAYRECIGGPLPTKMVEIQDIINKYESEKRNLTIATVEAIKSLNEMKVELILTSNLTGKELSDKIREINEERKKIIRNYIESIHELNMAKREELREIIEEIKVGKEIETDGIKVNVSRVVISVDGKEIEIKPGDNVTINVEGFVVRTRLNLRIRENRIEDTETNKTLNITPEKIRERVRERIRETVLERRGNLLVYSVDAEKSGRILGIVPVNVNLRYEISAENGETISVARPWWSFLVFG